MHNNIDKIYLCQKNGSYAKGFLNFSNGYYLSRNITIFARNDS